MELFVAYEPINIISALLKRFWDLDFWPESPYFQGNVNQEQKSKCVWLFGYAACVWEEWDQFGTRLSIDRQEQKIDETSRAIERFWLSFFKIKKI